MNIRFKIWLLWWRICGLLNPMNVGCAGWAQANQSTFAIGIWTKINRVIWIKCGDKTYAWTFWKSVAPKSTTTKSAPKGAV